MAQSMAASTQKPNMVILYLDQLRADALSCAGNPCIKTPHMDRLALEGVRFTNAFVSFPLCCPFRASFFTGKYAHAHGMYANHYPIPLNQHFLAEVFRDHGYQTGYIGKWHLDGGIKWGYVPPGKRRLGFEHFVGFNRGHAYFNSIFYRDSDQPLTCKRYEPDYQTDHLIAFMENSLDDPQGRPFLAMICYGPPHPPLVAPPYYLNLYNPQEVPLSGNVPKDPESQAKARQFLAAYYGLVTSIDHNVGRILDWLDKNELAQNTVVVLLSDHGELAGEHGLYGKKTYYDNSMRVPLIVRYPRCFPAARVTDGMVDLAVDAMPTLLELSGLPIPDTVQGTSFLSLLKGDTTPIRQAVYYQVLRERDGPERFPIPERGLRTLGWVYVRTREKPKVLFDLQNDPLEMNNLVDSAAHQDVLRRLDQWVAEFMIRTGDDWSIQAEFPPPDFQTHKEGDRYRQELLKQAVVEP